MNYKYNNQGQMKNQCVQLNTSISNIMAQQIDLDGASTPQYMEDSDRPLDFFAAQDPLYYRTLDPQKYYGYLEEQKKTNDSSRIANNINPVNPQIQ